VGKKIPNKQGRGSIDYGYKFCRKYLTARLGNITGCLTQSESRILIAREVIVTYNADVIKECANIII